MSRFSVFAILAVTLALAAQANAAACSAVSATNADPPTNGEAFVTWNASGVRIWDCKAGALVNPAQIDGMANLTSADGTWTGGFTYINDVARFNVTNTKEGKNYSFDLDNKPGLTQVEGALADARWTVNWLGAGPAGLTPGQQYLVRTDSVGGVTPTKCPSTKSNRIEVPYTTTYVLYNCEGDAKPASSAVSHTVGTIATAVVASAAFLF